MAVKGANTESEIVTRNGKPVSVILPIKKYQEMIERLEDAEDVAWLKRARRKTSLPSIRASAGRSAEALGDVIARSRHLRERLMLLRST